VVIVALANKLARFAWAVLGKKMNFDANYVTGAQGMIGSGTVAQSAAAGQKEFAG